MKKYLLKKQEEGGDLIPVCVEAPDPEVGDGELLVRVRACSLNYRDLLMKSGKSASGGDTEVVPLSDGAGEVIGVGQGVSGFSQGDRVAMTFFRDWESGRFDMRYHKAARGGSCDGVLSEVISVPSNSVVKIPDHLDFAEAATLPCAGVTAWQALMERGAVVGENDTVLCLGTGGVSVMALQMAKAAGAQVIITSSSEEKLEKAESLGADHGINYKLKSEWDEEVFRLTEKRGVDNVIEVGGPGTLGKSMNSVAAGGTISMIGVLTGFSSPEASLFPLVARAVNLNGIYVGSREMFERMNDFLSKHQIKPVIDRKFGFDEVREAYEYLESGSHFGKVVIEW